MGQDIAISVEHLSKVYRLYDKPVERLKESLHPLRKKYHRDFHALDDVSFEVKKGETVGIIGQNGSGKSTLLKIITGVLTPSAGQVRVNGRISALLELGTGFNPDLTGIENVYFSGTIMGYSREEMDARVDDILAFADIGEFVKQPVRIYSTGMFARLAFAVAINVDPDILIVDEALSVGDMAFQSKCYNKFREFQKENKTILFVTHSIDLILKYCQSAILLDQGRKVVQGHTKLATERFRKLMAPSLSKDDGQVVKHQKSDFMFDLKKQLSLNKSPNIYGSLEAEIIDYAVYNQSELITNHLYHNEEYSIKLFVLFHQSVSDPIIAFSLRSVDGAELTGINTHYLGEDFGLVSAGEVIEVKFQQKMVLNSGAYFLALGCTKFVENELNVIHRIYDAVHIDVVATTTGFGVAYSEANLEVKRFLI